MTYVSELVDPSQLGVGLGLRSEHYPYILTHKPPVPWFEALTENYLGSDKGLGSRPFEILSEIRKDYPIVLHGVSLSIGSTDALNTIYLEQLSQLDRAIEPLWVSDHLCWTGVGGKNLHDLLPLPYTESAIEHVSERIRQVQDALGRQLVIENVSSYLSFEHSEMEEWDFLAEVVRRADCRILLDVNNIYVSALNHQFNPISYLNAIPPKRVQQFHLAGHARYEKYAIDTHDHPVCDEVWELYEKALNRFGPVATLIEWDADIPEFGVLQEEAAKATALQEKVFGKAARNPSQPPRDTALVAMDLHSNG